MGGKKTKRVSETSYWQRRAHEAEVDAANWRRRAILSGTEAKKLQKELDGLRSENPDTALAQVPGSSKVPRMLAAYFSLTGGVLADDI